MNKKKIWGFIFGNISVFLFVSCSSFASVMEGVGRVGRNILKPSTVEAVVETGKSIGKAAEEITPQQEYYIGRAVGATLLSRYRIHDLNSQLTKYLNKIGNALVINSEKPELYNGYHVMVLDSEEINAFATSGGHIFVTRGLLACADSEDALAAVIAHEIAHIQLQHSIKAIKTARITEAVRVTSTSALSIAADGLELGELTSVFDDSVSEIVTTLINSGYSKTQEFEADRVALKLLSETGYQPDCLLDMLILLQENQKKYRGGFNDTHPSPSERIKRVKNELRQYSLQNTRLLREERFQAVVETN